MDVEQVVVRLVADATQYLRIMDLAEGRLLGFTLGVGASFAKQATLMAVAYERGALALEIMTKSAGIGRGLLRDIEQMAVETPFHSAELVGYAKELMAFGTEVDAVIPTLHALGDVAAGTGGRMDRIVLAFGQVRTAGKLMGQELRQFTNAGIPIIEYLARVLDKPTTAVRQMVSQGQVGFDAVAKAFNLMTQEGGRFHGMMDRINKETISGRWENFTEKLQLVGRNFVLAAFEGIGLRETLGSLTDRLGTFDPSKVVEFFAGVRAGLYTTGEFISRLLRWIKGVVVDVKDWAAQQEKLVRILLITAAAIAAIIVVVKAVAIATAVFSALWAVLTLLATPLGVAIMLLTSIVWLLDNLGAFKGLGEGLARGWNSFAGEALNAWKGITAAVKSGELEAAFDIVVKTLQLAWKTLILSLRAEWERFTFNMSTDVLLEWHRSVTLPIDKEFAELRADMWRKVGRDDLAENALETYRQRVKAVEGPILQRQAERMPELEARLARITSGTQPEREALQQAVTSARARALFESQTGRNIYQYYAVPVVRRPDTLQPQPGAREFELTLGSKVIDQLTRPPAGTPLAGLAAAGGGPGMVAVEQTYATMWERAAHAITKVQDEVLRGAWDSEDMKFWVQQANEATLALDRFSEALMGVKGAAGIPIPLQVRPEAAKAANDLIEALNKGLDPLDRFRKHVEYLTEAYRGPFLGGLAAGGGPMAALPDERTPGILGLGGLFSRQVLGLGLFREYEDLRKATTRREALPPPLLRGSREAQDAINRAQWGQLNTEQEILRTLREANIIHNENAKYQKDVSQTLLRLLDEGVILQPEEP